MNADELARACDELHEYIDQGPGENPRGFASALGAVRRIRAAASWDYPLIVLTRIEMRLATWFGPETGRAADAGQGCRQALLGDISTLEEAWDRPRT